MIGVGGIVMRRVLIGLALASAMIPAKAQISGKTLANCGNDDVDVSVSISACTTILRAPPEANLDRLSAHFFRGMDYGKKGLQDRAIADFTNAIALKPKPETLAHLYAGISMAHYHAGRFAECIAFANKVIALQPEKSDGYRLRGTGYEFSGQRDKAIDDYRTALTFDPDSPNLKAALSRLGATPEA
jgi:tetratricopeptide (TPR) repeat protein